MQPGLIHHVEYYVHDLGRTVEFWGWLFKVLGWSPRSTWANGADWAHPSGTYVVFARTEERARGKLNARQAPGLNHLAFQGPAGMDRADLVRELVARGARMIHDDPDYLCFEEANGFAVEIYLA